VFVYAKRSKQHSRLLRQFGTTAVKMTTGWPWGDYGVKEALREKKGKK